MQYTKLKQIAIKNNNKELKQLIKELKQIDKQINNLLNSNCNLKDIELLYTKQINLIDSYIGDSDQ